MKLVPDFGCPCSWFPKIRIQIQIGTCCIADKAWISWFPCSCGKTDELKFKFA